MSSTPARDRSKTLWSLIALSVAALLAVASFLIIRATATGISAVDLVVSTTVLCVVALWLGGVQLMWVYEEKQAQRTDPKKSHPLRAAVGATFVGVFLVAGIVLFAASDPNTSPDSLNRAAAVLTATGLVFLFVSDLIPMWQREDGPQDYDAKVTTFAEWFRTAGHGVVIIAAALFLAALFHG